MRSQVRTLYRPVFHVFHIPLAGPIKSPVFVTESSPITTAIDLDVTSGTVEFGIAFTGFDEDISLNLP